MRLEGHTDARGTHAHNQKLGMARAKAVEAALSVQGGKAAKQITSVSDEKKFASVSDNVKRY